MPRRESDLVTTDSWNIDGLFNSHAMHTWAERRVKGILSAELTEAVRKHIGENILGLSMSDKGTREKIREWIEAEENKEIYDGLRAKLRADAQAGFDMGSYGTGTRGPVGYPPRVAALFPFMQELYENVGKGDLLENTTREQRIALVAKFEAQYGGPNGKYRDDIRRLTAHISGKATPAMQVMDDLLSD